MKKVFTYLSTFSVCLFCIWLVSLQLDSLIYHYYPSVSILSRGEEVTYEEVSDALTNLAEKENSLIAKTITETDDSGRTTTSYDVFGKGELPQGLVKADRLVASQANLAENYYVVKGNLDIKVVENVLQSLGLVDSYIYRPTLLNSLSLFLGRGAPSLGLIIFILTNLALTVVGQIVYLRSAGIEMLSEVRSWQIASRFLRVDGRDIALATGGALVFGLIAILILGWPMVYYRFIAIGIAFYACLLFFLSLSTSIGFMIALNISQLQKLIKGALPLKAIFAILLVGQCLAVCIISIGASRTLTYVGVLHTLTIGEKAWQERQDVFSLSLNREAFIADEAMAQQQRMAWSHVILESYAKNNVMLVQHHLRHNTIKEHTIIESSKEIPLERVLYVTPNYIQSEGGLYDFNQLEEIKQLGKGEIALLLPKSLQNDASVYQAYFEDMVGKLLADGERSLSLHSNVYYISDEKRWFIYNHTPINYEQFLQAPLIVVLSPESFEETSYFWENALPDFVFFKDKEMLEQLLDKYNLQNTIGSLLSSKQHYNTLRKNVQLEILMTLSPTILGIFTSILLFNTMNLLYFETFKREIAIKRIAGMRFIELHGSYLGEQVGSALIGMGLAMFMTKSVIVSLGVVVALLMNSWMLLNNQAKREEKIQLSVLNGR
ncbi:DUF1430 domain-containing protein [Streptococcus suis]|uniref:DUF1430 domain-containing protein n=1 Tax=Streptococcus suis TaxID=1307 RepID=A0A4T2GY94_STRSU|nr:DUF1430 domain-containing protein [Streptococcus suis]MBY4635368.1 DUF1430 domain-containing protein [Streptococcus suis]NQM17037.1 DUF1430 domain-containing protein [Streptococcus suis]TII02791.1 DUF1430 domain-containing protein [Streptococcus suis]HEM4257097.1 DUF1430 domain-containing protein [Streptococcus suis]HEM6577428.1 DUF1430 domain-containing protein [Streptococcus suis]